MGHNSRSLTQVSGSEVVIRLRDGDVGALEEVADFFAGRLGAVASTLLGRHDLVQDVVQDVLIALWDRRSQLDPQTNLAGYLYRMVRNRAMDILRHEGTELRIATDVATTAPVKVSKNLAEQALATGDLYTHLHNALQHIPVTQRQVFLLNFEHGLSYAEIAEALGLTTGSVRTLMYRATQRLAQIFPKDMLF